MRRNASPALDSTCIRLGRPHAAGRIHLSPASAAMRHAARFACRLPLLSLFAVTCLLAPRAAFAAWGQNGAVVCNAANNTAFEAAYPDGAGGVIVVWLDYRASTVDGAAYAQRYSPSGVPLWAANGIQVSPSTIGNALAVTTDGAGGVIIAYEFVNAVNVDDADIWAQRVLPNGAKAWGTNGVDVCPVAGPTSGILKHQRTPTICADGAGGAFIAWQDFRANNGPPADIYAQHVNANGTPLWISGGVQVCGNTFEQTAPLIALAQSGSAVVEWTDPRTGAAGQYAQRVSDPSGAVSWTVDGVAVTTATTTGGDFRMVGDGVGGAYLGWTEFRGTLFGAYLSRLAAANGASLWGANGKLVSAVGAGYKMRPALVASGTNLIVGWQDHRNGGANIYAQKFDPNGGELWTAGGVRLTDHAYNTDFPIGAPDGSSGGLFAARDWPNGTYVGMGLRVDANGNNLWGLNGVVTNTSALSIITALTSDGAGGGYFVYENGGGTAEDLYAQYVKASSNLADYDAVLNSVADVPNDEGGLVRLSVTAPPGDTAPATPPVTGYNVWRLVGAGQRAVPADATGPGRVPAEAGDARARGLELVERLAAEGADAHAPRTLDPAAAQAVGFPAGTWESLGFTAVRGASNYLMPESTPVDSSTGGPADRSYVITVHTPTPSYFFVSNTASGHSVDNLPPAAPAGLIGNITGPNTVIMNWTPNLESDLAYYAVHRGSSSGFTPSPANRIGTPTAPTFTDAGYSASFYKLSAVDRHGNESAFTPLAPAVSGVEGAEFLALSLAPPAPNPMTGGHLAVAFALPRDENAALEIYDAAGRLTRVLARGSFAAGRHAREWDGLDQKGSRAGAGIYFARLSAAGEIRSARFVRLE